MRAVLRRARAFGRRAGSARGPGPGGRGAGQRRAEGWPTAATDAGLRADIARLPHTARDLTFGSVPARYPGISGDDAILHGGDGWRRIGSGWPRRCPL